MTVHVHFVPAGAKLQALGLDWQGAVLLMGAAAVSRLRKLRREGQVRAVGTEGFRLVVHHGQVRRLRA